MCSKLIRATSFLGFSPTRPTEREGARDSVGRVGENPGNEVEIRESFQTRRVDIPTLFCTGSRAEELRVNK